jgi:hypothetical protein
MNEVDERVHTNIQIQELSKLAKYGKMFRRHNRLYLNKRFNHS